MFSLLVHEYPLTVTVSALVIYVAVGLLFVVINPASIIQGIVWKIATVVGLAKGIQAAAVYKQECNQPA